MGWGGTLLSFGAPAIALYVTARIAVPSVTQSLGLPPVVWFLTFSAFYVLGPLAVIALLRLRGESLEDVAVWRERLRFRPLGAQDWRLIGIALATTVPVSATIYFVLTVLGVRDITPSFLANSGEQALAPNDLLLAWLVFGVVSIAAQEVLWRGVYLPRQEQLLRAHGWWANATGWTLFHLVLGWKLVLVLAPMIVAVPFIAQKRGSSMAGAAFHALVYAVALATAFMVTRR